MTALWWSPVAAASAFTERKSTFPNPSPDRLSVSEVENGIWLVSFMSYDLGYIDLEEKTLQPVENPFGPRPQPTPVPAESRSRGTSGETETSNAGEQLAKG